MKWLYNVGIGAYRLGIGIASLTGNEKAKSWLRGRARQKDFTSIIPSKQLRRVWFHCASAGEFEQARPIIEGLKASQEIELFVTFFSPSGYEMYQEYDLADAVLYLPLDTKKNAFSFLNALDPDIAVFVKYEFWYHYLNELRTRVIPTYLISGIFRENQHFFKSYGKWFSEPFQWYETIFVQNRESYDLLSSIGLENVQISGDSRLDRVLKIREENKEFPLVDKFKGTNKLLIIGSSWEKEEEVFSRYFNEEKLSGWKYIFAPHEFNDDKILQLVQKFRGIQYSEMNDSNVSNADVIVADGYGYLSRIYKYGDLALIGGGFTTGIHSILEPAVFGCPSIFGPDNKSFTEARSLLKSGAAFEIHDYADFISIFTTLNDSEEKLESAALTCERYVKENAGAATRVVKKLNSSISSL